MNLRIQELFSYLRDQWITVLAVVAVITTGAYLIIISDIRDQEGDSIQLKFSTRQAWYVESIALAVRELLDETNLKNQRKIRARLLDNVGRFEDMHQSLSAGDKFIPQGARFIRRQGRLTSELERLYYERPHELDNQVKVYIKEAKSVLSEKNEEISLNNAHVAYVLSEARQRLGDSLDYAVTLYQNETNYRFRRTQDLQTFMYVLTIASLLLVGSIILRPLVEKLNDSMGKLREEKDFTDNILNTAQALIIAIDSNAQIVLFNAFAEESTGWLEKELIGANFFDGFLIGDDRERMEQVFSELFSGQSNQQKELETLLNIRSDEQLSIIWHTAVVRDPLDDKPILFLATGIDITERKLADERLQIALSELGDLNLRLQDEIQLAAVLQKVLLPEPEFELPGIKGQTLMVTSSEVGGDYYDYYKVGESNVVLLIGDVSGHGVAAGTMVSAAKAGVSPLINRGVVQPSEILRSLNGTIRETAQESLLMTMLCLNFDASDGSMVIANAGHVLPYHFSQAARQWTMLESFGFPLGQNPDFDYAAAELQLNMTVGDRLFLYTDGLVEEESSLGEAFGYERLEHVLNEQVDADPAVLEQAVLAAVQAHSGREVISDDVTLLVIDHTDRVQQVSTTRLESGEIVKLSESVYRTQEYALPKVSRQFVIFLAEDDFSDLLWRFTQDGIRRVLPAQNPFYQQLGWDRLIMQHQEPADDDLYQLVPSLLLQRQFQLTDSDQKGFIIEETQAWLMEQGMLSPEHVDGLIVVLDEMIENGLYAAPRDGQNRQFYEKGTVRQLGENEQITIDIAIGDGVLGLMLTDNWGTFTPAIFLKYMTRTLGQGIEAGVGGGGLYMMWFLSDYLQVRVRPHLQTQVTALWDFNQPLDASLNSGFQFLYHSEYDEAVSYDDQ